MMRRYFGLPMLGALAFFAAACDGSEAVAEGDIEKAIKEPGKIVLELKRFELVPEKGNCVATYVIHNNTDRKIAEANTRVGLVKDGKVIKSAETWSWYNVAPHTVLSRSQANARFPLKLIFDDIDCDVVQEARMLFRSLSCRAFRDGQEAKNFSHLKKFKPDDFEQCGEQVRVIVRYENGQYKKITHVRNRKELESFLLK